ncbi:hypothetical protein JYG23_11380 [Sedimentibacter sp. zth1]|uniref:Wzz/FepE/Etk N-terminal domain-containing protein n=1 Tax=Sedimentibacter sp. zth1 TaxID=2816908 RepID=UPI001A935475|nr:Wzz/FepE/Etk N-terminal domain-containing protein [Sedimentibacter sp. zth1]QSX05273.1 hypothetical protein JYG23_11380 [Sedimentibacter sp. zth1]
MDENLQVDKHSDEIDLKDLFVTIWKGKKVIIAFALIIAILTCLITMFIVDPVYETKLSILINMPDTIATKYGDYKLLMTTNEQYIELIKSNDVLIKTIKDMGYDDSKVSVDNLVSRISVNKDDKKPNQFYIKVAANNKEESLKLAQCLYNNYIEFMDLTIKNKCAEHFSIIFTTAKNKGIESLERTESLLEKNIELLNTIPKTINSKEAIKDIDTTTLDYVVLENAINENYTKVEANIIANQQTINSMHLNITKYCNYLNELNSIQDKLSEKDLSMEFCQVTETNIYLPSEPIAPSHKTSPSTSLNTVIGGVIGGMIGVMVVLIKKYWF